MVSPKSITVCSVCGEQIDNHEVHEAVDCIRHLKEKNRRAFVDLERRVAMLERVVFGRDESP